MNYNFLASVSTAFLSALLLLSACSSDDKSVSKVDGDITSYETRKDLPDCTAKQEGERAYIEDEDVVLTCKDKKWDSAKKSTSEEDGEDTEGDSSDSSEKTSSSSGESAVVAGEMTDKRDKQVYKTTKIGNQVWMAQNLNYKMPQDLSYQSGSWHCPSGKTTEDESCKKYGKLYKIDAVESANDLCPEGWAIPNNSDWEKLIDYVDKNNGEEGVGKSLKAVKGWYKAGYEQVDEYSKNIRTAVATGKDSFGFSALPAGSCWNNGEGTDTYNCYTDDETRFLTLAKTDFGNFSAMKLSFDDDEFVEDLNAGFAYVSVRCVKEIELGTCNKDNNGEIKKGHSNYICDNGKWRPATNLELDIKSLGSCKASLEGGIKNGEYGSYRCVNGNWQEIVPGEESLDNDECREGNTYYSDTYKKTYTCIGGTWQVTEENENPEEEDPNTASELGSCEEDAEITTYNDHQYICKGGVWVSL